MEVVQSPESRVQTRPEKLRLLWMPPPVNGSKFTRFSLWSGTGPSGDGIAVPVKGLKESLRLTIRDVASRRLFRRPDAGTASKPIVLPRLRPGYAGWRLLALWFQNRRPVSWSHRLCASPPFQRLLAERGSQRKQEKSLSNMSIAFLSRHEGSFDVASKAKKNVMGCLNRPSRPHGSEMRPRSGFGSSKEHCHWRSSSENRHSLPDSFLGRGPGVRSQDCAAGGIGSFPPSGLPLGLRPLPGPCPE